MTIMTEHDRRRNLLHLDTGATVPEPRASGRAEPERTYNIVHRGKRFLENARSDQWRANIVLQLAESVGDKIDSPSGYIDMLLAIFPLLLRFKELGLDGYETSPGEQPTNEQAKYLGWFAELGTLERNTAGADVASWLSADNCRMYGASNGGGGTNRIYMATRQP